MLSVEGDESLAPHQWDQAQEPLPPEARCLGTEPDRFTRLEVRCQVPSISLRPQMPR
jgi:hypothetical protein